MSSDPDVRHAASHYRLARTAISRRRAGELLGRGFGNSHEFQDYREYHPGDDLRHLDWAAFGRSDQPMIRLYREESQPRTQILLDASRSMAVPGREKSTFARQLAWLFALLAAEEGGRPSVVALDDHRPLREFDLQQLESPDILEWSGVKDLPRLIAERALPSPRHASRYVISDFLFPHDPRALVASLANQASDLILVQVLTETEIHPHWDGGARLVDAESDEYDDIILDQSALTTYQARLLDLQRGLSDEARRVHATFVSLPVDAGLNQACRGPLCQMGILQPK